jgi:hypothetical protein
MVVAHDPAAVTNNSVIDDAAPIKTSNDIYIQAPVERVWILLINLPAWPMIDTENPCVISWLFTLVCHLPGILFKDSRHWLYDSRRHRSHPIGWAGQRIVGPHHPSTDLSPWVPN